jgi:hypothetical protein
MRQQLSSGLSNNVRMPANNSHGKNLLPDAFFCYFQLRHQNKSLHAVRKSLRLPDAKTGKRSAG